MRWLECDANVTEWLHWPVRRVLFVGFEKIC